MPRLRRRIKLRTAYDEGHFAQLREGPDALYACVFGGGWESHSAMSPAQRADRAEAMRTAWEELGEDLLADFIEANPGARPWAWWMFDALEPRRLLAGPGSCYWKTKTFDWRETFGAPTAYAGHDFTEPSVYETELEYLTRLNLLTDAERTALAQDNNDNEDEQ